MVLRAYPRRPLASHPTTLPAPGLREQRGRFHGLATLFAVLALLLYSGAGRLILELGQNAIRGISWSFTLIVILIAVSRGADFASVAWGGKWALLFAAFAISSVLWSTEPSFTARRGMALVVATLFGLYLVVDFNERERLRIVCWTVGVCAVGSLVLGLAVPSWGLMPDDESWRGLFSHKNQLGKMMALSVGAFLLLAQSGGKRRTLGLAGAGLSVVVLVLSRSVSALVIGVTIALVTPILPTFRLKYPRHLGILIAAVVLGEAIALGLYFEWEEMLVSLGRDATLTGRTELWLEVLSLIQSRPWLGYGLGGFWLGWEGESATVWSAIGWHPAHAHNGLLDVTLDLGILGLALFAAGYVAACASALRAARSSSQLKGPWALMFLMFVLLSESTESSLLAQGSLMWVMYIATVCGLSQHEGTPRVPWRLGGALRTLSPGVRRRLQARGRTQPPGAFG